MEIEFVAARGKYPSVPEEIHHTWSMIAANAQVQPASKFIPDWWKNQDTKFESEQIKNNKQAQIRGGGEHTTVQSTTRNCPGIYDYMTSGYIVPAWSDIRLEWKQGKAEAFDLQTGQMLLYLQQQYGQSMPMLMQHEFKQAKDAPFWDNSMKNILKFSSPWNLRTSEGVSCFFTHPYYHSSTDYTVMPGIMDTDVKKYSNTIINVFLRLNKQGKPIFIERGTPLIQIIPFKRSDVKFKCITNPTQDESRYYEELVMDEMTMIQRAGKGEAGKCPFGHSLPDPNRRKSKKMMHHRLKDGKNYNAGM